MITIQEEEIISITIIIEETIEEEIETSQDKHILSLLEILDSKPPLKQSNLSSRKQGMLLM